MKTELRLNDKRAGSNKHGKSAKDISFTDFEKILHARNNIRKPSLDQANNMLQEQNIANKGIA